MSTARNQLYTDYRCTVSKDWLSFIYSNKDNWDLLLQGGCSFDILRFQDHELSCILRISTSDLEKMNEVVPQIKRLNFTFSETNGFEVGRFGGVDSASNIMTFFQQSSKAILKLFLDHDDELMYEDILSIAVFMGKVYFKTMSIEQKRQKECLALYYNHWGDFLPRDINLTTIQASYSEEVGILKTLEQVSPIHSWSEALKNHFEIWALTTNNLVLNLKNLQTQKLIAQRPVEFHYKKSESKRSNLLEIYNDCFHFIMNKLGVNNEDEALVIYLISALMEVSLEDV